MSLLLTGVIWFLMLTGALYAALCCIYGKRLYLSDPSLLGSFIIWDRIGSSFPIILQTLATSIPNGAPINL
jgi:hypothetical protein